ncbi:unnamed protein product [Cladocopium goreaui]|uniref:Enhancer of mRNA-decapping protein 4 n=1 Tax=Cladocopium goreaui TaxID=2562237 RepID=A0A9P1BZI4_9DINO|nr:unnamed protein product [Cladocopium goreaui]
MLASNPSYVIYAFKEGSIRVINQSAKDHFKLSNASKARIVDLALTADVTVNDYPDTLLLCLDEEGNITIFELEVVEAGSSGTERTRWLEVALREVDMPQRVILQPQDSRWFVTIHASSLRLWSLPQIKQEISMGTTLHPTAPQLQRCCCSVPLPAPAHDVAFSIDGTCLLALTKGSLMVWKRQESERPGLQLIQQLAIQSDEDFPEHPEMLRFVGTKDVQALVLASASGCDLRVYSFSPRSPSPVGPLMQLLRLAPAGSSAIARLEVDKTEHRTLAASFTNRNCFILLPLVQGWSTSSRIAFPFAQRFGACAPCSHHALMTALSLKKTIKDLFLYRATRAVDQDGKWNIVVHQLPENMVRPQEAKLKVEVKPPEQKLKVEVKPPEQKTPEEQSPEVSPQVNGFKGHDEGEEAEEPEAAASSSAQKHDVVDKEFVKQIAASFVKGLEKRKADLAERIVSEVAKSRGKSGMENEVLNQVLAKVKEVREVQAASEKSLQAAARQASDAWAETSAASMASQLSKEFGKISDGVAATLAKELAQSRKFCEALARGVQKSQAAATKQALEALRPQEIQESLGFGESLEETLAPVFKEELRAHFEQELGPLIGLRVTEMLSAFREQMTECLKGIAVEHEQAALRLGRDLAPVVAEELKEVKDLLQTSGSSGSRSLSEAELEDLSRQVEVEVIQPLHARVKELTSQVKALRVEVEQLQRTEGKQPSSPEAEASQARELQQLFQEGSVEDAFERALQRQEHARYVDFLEQLCSLVQPDQWLNEEPAGLHLGSQVKMKLMYALAQQLSDKSLDEGIFHSKVEWINELWLGLDLGDKALQAKDLCTKMIEALERAEGPGREQALRKLKRTLQQAAKMLERD